DVIAEELRGLVPVRRAARRVEQRDVIRVRELLAGGAGELAEPDGKHGAAQRVLERLPRAEVRGDGQGGHHLGEADGLLDLRSRRANRGLRWAHRAILTARGLPEPAGAASRAEFVLFGSELERWVVALGVRRVAAEEVDLHLAHEPVAELGVADP